MGWFRQESAYEKRMRELEEEAERVRKNLQNLMKSANQESLRTRAAPVKATRSAEETRSAELALYGENEGDTSESISPSRDRVRSASGFAPSNKPLKPDNLAHYLASGSFGKRGSPTRERMIQRNKAIFMLICALLALFSLYTWLN